MQLPRSQISHGAVIEERSDTRISCRLVNHHGIITPTASDILQSRGTRTSLDVAFALTTTQTTLSVAGMAQRNTLMIRLPC